MQERHGSGEQPSGEYLTIQELSTWLNISRGSAWTNLTRNEDSHDCNEDQFSSYSGDPAYSPDGKKLAFTSGTYYDNVVVADVDGSNPQRNFFGDSDGEDERGNSTSIPDWGLARQTP